jgi:hypothetical protein
MSRSETPKETETAQVKLVRRVSIEARGTPPEKPCRRPSPIVHAQRHSIFMEAISATAPVMPIMQCSVDMSETLGTAHMKPFRKISTERNFTSEPTKIASPVTALKHRRRMRFSLELNQFFPIVNIDNMDKADIHETWYKKRDYKAIKKNLIHILRKMANGEKIAETNMQTLRGLEHRTREERLLRRNLRLAALTAVMNEQERQWDEDVQDDERLAKVCRDVTSHCQEKSHSKALQDEAALKKDYEKMRRTFALDLQNESALKDKSRFTHVKFTGPNVNSGDGDFAHRNITQRTHDTQKQGHTTTESVSPIVVSITTSTWFSTSYFAYGLKSTM